MSRVIQYSLICLSITLSSHIKAMICLPSEAPVIANCTLLVQSPTPIIESRDNFTCHVAVKKEEFSKTPIARAIKAGDIDTFKYELANKGWRGWMRWIFLENDILTARAWRCLRYAALEATPKDSSKANEIIRCLCHDIVQRSQADNNNVSRICAIRFYYDFKADQEIENVIIPEELLDVLCRYKNDFMHCSYLEQYSEMCRKDKIAETEEFCKDRKNVLNRRLQDAADYNQLNKMKKLIDQGADVNAKIDWPEKGHTIKEVFLPNTDLLSRAVIRGKVEVVDFLIERGAMLPVEVSIPDTLKQKDWKEVFHDLAIEVRNSKNKK